MTDRTLQVVLNARDNMSPTLVKAGNAATTMGEALEQAGDKGTQSIASLKSELKEVGGLLSGFGAAITAAVGLSVRGFANLEAAMANVASIAGDANIDQLTDQVRSLAIELGVSPTGLAEGLYDLISSGIDAADAMAVLRVSAIAARAGLADTSVAARAITSILNAYHLEASEAANVSDVLFQTVKSGVIEFDTLANNLSQVIPLGATLNVRITELAAAYAELTLQSFSATQAETGIANILRSVINPTNDLTEAIQEQGYASAEMLIQTEGLTGFLAFLQEETGGSSAALQDLLGTAEGTTAAIALLSSGVEGYTARVQEMEDAQRDGATTGDTFAIQMETTAAAIDRAQAAVSDLALTLGANVAPAVTFAADAVSGYARALSLLPEPLQAAASYATVLTGGASLLAGGLLILAPRIMDTVTALKALRGAISVSAIAGLGAYGAAVTAAAGAGLVLGASVAGIIDAFHDGESATDRLADAFDRLKSGDVIGFFQALRGEAEHASAALADVNTTLIDLFSEAAKQRALGNEVAGNYIGQVGLINQEVQQLNSTLLESQELQDRALSASFKTGADPAEELARLREEYSLTAEEAEAYTETVNALSQAYLDPSINLDELLTRQRDLRFAYENDILTLDEYNEALASLAREYGLLPEVADSAAGIIVNFGDAADDATFSVDGLTEKLNEAVDATKKQAKTADELTAELQAMQTAFIDAALAIGGFDDALSQINLTSMASDTSRFAENAITANEALDNTFRIIVGNTDAIRNQAEGVLSWADSLIAVRGELGRIDELIDDGFIDQTQYEAAQNAYDGIADSVFRIQGNLDAVQAIQAPFIAESIEGTAAWTDELLNMDAAQQRVALAFMDTNTVATAQEIILNGAAAATGKWGDSGREAFDAMIHGALQANPLLFDVLETMGIISGTPVDFDINWDQLAQGESEIAKLTTSIDYLVDTMREIYGLPPIDIKVEGADEALQDVDLVYNRVVNADGTEAYMVLKADADTGELENFGEIVDSYTDPDNPNIAHIKIEADDQTFWSTIDLNTGEIGTATIKVEAETSGDWITDARRGAAQGAAAFLGIPDSVSVTANVVGGDDVTTLSSDVENLPDSATVTINADIPAYTEIGELFDLLREIDGYETTIVFTADDQDVTDAVTYWQNGGSEVTGDEGGAGALGSLATLTVAIEADDSDVSDAILHWQAQGGQEGGGTTPGAGSIATLTVAIEGDAGGENGVQTVLANLQSGGKDGYSVSVDITANDDATETINAVDVLLADLDGDTATVTTEDVDNASDGINAVDALLSDLDGNSATVSMFANDYASDDIYDVSSLLGGLNGRTATTYIDTVYRSWGVSATAQLGGIPGYATGGVLFRAGEGNRPEMAHFATGGTAMIPRDGFYVAPQATYISPSNAVSTSYGGHTFNITINGSSREEMRAFATEEFVPMLTRAISEHERSMGVMA